MGGRHVLALRLGTERGVPILPSGQNKASRAGQGDEGRVGLGEPGLSPASQSTAAKSTVLSLWAGALVGDTGAGLSQAVSHTAPTEICDTVFPLNLPQKTQWKLHNPGDSPGHTTNPEGTRGRLQVLPRLASSQPR